MILVPVFAIYILLFIKYQNKKSIVKALADSWIALAFFIWGITEVLSIFKIWTRITVLLLWLLLLVCLLYVCYREGYTDDIKVLLRKRMHFLKINNEYEKWFVCFGIYFGIIIILGILSGQYNMDSMVYHLPRIMHWIQNQSVGHFAPGIEFQVRYPCLTEYLVAQIYLFSNNDRLANLIQTFAYLGSSIMVFGISKKMGVSVKASFTASFIYLMIPMALAQSFTTQTDNVAGLFLLVFIFNILEFIQIPKLKMDRHGFVSAIRLALNVMLGYLCKPTVCFVMLVFFIWMCIVRLIKKDSLIILLKYIVVGALTAIITYMPLYAKSYQTYTTVDKAIAEEAEREGQGEEVINSVGRALAPDVFNVKSALTDPAQFVITCIQNLGRNSTSICFPKYNEDWEKLVVKVGGWLNKDVSSYRTQKDALFFYQDTASNPCVMILTLLVCISALVRFSQTNKKQTVYIICSVAGIIIQCGMMGYTQYRTRYLVGAMAVLCPSIAIAIDTLKVDKKLQEIVMALCIFGALIGGINTFSFELPRIKESFEGDKIHQYMLGNLEDEYVYRELVRIINENGYRRVGLDGGIYMEYPLWQGIEGLDRLENVNVTDIYFSQYEDITFKPECIIKVVDEEEEIKEGDTLKCHDVTYQCIWSIHWYQTYFTLFAELEGK